ncbi:MAG: hypothetical protein E7642_03305 [Ruminococcaceae bacterium]|nr:hypothetical protein [Oscillospiraceae bacterium]
MLKRIITSIFALCVLVPILLLSHTWVFPIAISVVSVMCLFEMFRCMGYHKKFALTLPAYAISALLPVFQRIFENGAKVIALSAVCAVAYLVYAFALVIWSHGRFTYNDMASSVLTSLYIVFAMNMILYIRDFGNNGHIIYLLIFIGAWITDIFAYFTGVFFGKHKLIEDVSPKKTIEGSIGGTVFCALSFVATGIIADMFFGCNANLIFLGCSGVFISFIAQIGDLIMSVIKRHYGIKDYGKIFPGHGGMLDRFDSILAVSVGVAAMCMISFVINIPIL